MVHQIIQPVTHQNSLVRYRDLVFVEGPLVAAEDMNEKSDEELVGEETTKN